MNPRSKIRYGIGCLIADSVLILEAVIDIYTGKITPTELIFQIMLCVILTVPVIVLLKKYARNNKH